MPRVSAGAYKQMPYEAIGEAECKAMVRGVRLAVRGSRRRMGQTQQSKLLPLDFSLLYGSDTRALRARPRASRARSRAPALAALPDKFCDSGRCDVELPNASMAAVRDTPSGAAESGAAAVRDTPSGVAASGAAADGTRGGVEETPV